MTYNYNYAELLGRELLEQRRREAEHERLIRSLTPANPSILKKVWIILRSRWQDHKQIGIERRGPSAISPLPKSSQSL
ncbi:MAG: hypothetical protein ACK2TZ_12290 [Anaerolineales bacterium]|jgi:hypothetical protein